MNPQDPEPEFGQDDGEPLSMLREQGWETNSDFLAKVRNRIHRRSTTAQVVSYSWHASKLVLVEMASMVNYIFRVIGGNRRSQ